MRTALLTSALLTLALGNASCLSRSTAPLAGKFQVNGPKGTTWEFGYHDYDYGRAVSSVEGGTQQLGRGCSYSILNLVAWGDSSIGRWLAPAAQPRSTPTSITHADVDRLELSFFLPVFTRHCLTAWGR